MKERVLVSACLLGCACRYDGVAKEHAELQELLEQYEVIPVCPEQMGGLPTPRSPAERRGDRVVNREGTDVTAAFYRGAEETLRLAQRLGCRLAILKERSPSCGCGQIYDGTFSRTLAEGRGVTAELLEKNGIRVMGESQTIPLRRE